MARKLFKRCPECNGPARVQQSRHLGGVIERRMFCKDDECGYRFTCFDRIPPPEPEPSRYGDPEAETLTMRTWRESIAKEYMEVLR